MKRAGWLGESENQYVKFDNRGMEIEGKFVSVFYGRWKVITRIENKGWSEVEFGSI